MFAPCHSVDLIEELRLRCWARKHYVTAEARQAVWHPIIHEEMQQIDFEQLVPAKSESAAVHLLRETAPPQLHPAHEPVIPHGLRIAEFETEEASLN